jgi:hypothetical protein
MKRLRLLASPTYEYFLHVSLLFVLFPVTHWSDFEMLEYINVWMLPQGNRCLLACSRFPFAYVTLHLNLNFYIP